MFPVGDSASAGTDVSLIDRGLFNKRKKRILTLWGNWRLQFPGQPAEAAVDGARGSKGLRNSEHCKHPASAAEKWATANQSSCTEPTCSEERGGDHVCGTHMKRHLISEMGKGNDQCSFFFFRLVSFPCSGEELRLRNEDNNTQGDWYCSTVHKPHPRHQKMIFIFHFHVDWLY